MHQSQRKGNGKLCREPCVPDETDNASHVAITWCIVNIRCVTFEAASTFDAMLRARCAVEKLIFVFNDCSVYGLNEHSVHIFRLVAKVICALWSVQYSLSVRFAGVKDTFSASALFGPLFALQGSALSSPFA